MKHCSKKKLTCTATSSEGSYLGAGGGPPGHGSHSLCTARQADVGDTCLESAVEDLWGDAAIRSGRGGQHNRLSRDIGMVSSYALAPVLHMRASWEALSGALQAGPIMLKWVQFSCMINSLSHSPVLPGCESDAHQCASSCFGHARVVIF